MRNIYKVHREILFKQLQKKKYMEKKFDFRSIKTINDACEKTGTDFEAFMAMIEPMPEHIQALCALELIIKAINDGWQNPLDGDTFVYFPWVYVYNNYEKLQIDRNNPGRKDLIRFTRPDGDCGLASAVSHRAWSVSNAGIGSRLACKTRELALYVATDFKDLLASWALPMEDCNILERYCR